MSIEEINDFCKDSFIGFLGIEFLACGDDCIEARMPVDAHKFQPMGLLHGGASLAFAETLASVGSFLLVENKKYTPLGLQVSGNHVAAMGEGTLFGRAEIVHKGQLTHVWDVKMSDQRGKLICVARVTMIIKEKTP